MNTGLKGIIANDYAQRKFWRVSSHFAGVMLLAGLLFFITTTASSAIAPPAAPDPPPPLQIAAWMPTSWDTKLARESFTAHADKLNVISPFWYHISPTAELAPFRGARDAGLVLQAHEANVLVIPTIANNFDRQLIHNILQDDNLAQNLRQNILAEALGHGYDGIDLDFENLAAEDRDEFSAWVALLAQEMHEHDLLLTITVQPKTSDMKGWHGAGALDYRALGEVADEIRIMAYGWCWAGGCAGNNPPPGPIAPLHWQRQVISYAKNEIPADKIMLGIHLYGYDWPAPPPKLSSPPQALPTPSFRNFWQTWRWQQHQPGPPTPRQWLQICFRPIQARPAAGPSLAPTAISPLATDFFTLTSNPGKALVWQQAHELMIKHGAQLHWWEAEERGPVGEPWFSYANATQTVTFANAESVQERVDMAKEEGLRGVIFWRLGGEDPDIWSHLP